MFGLFKKRITLTESGIMAGLDDRHTHILPCVDDGVRSMKEAIAILNMYESMGVRRVVLTPHIMEDYPENTPTMLRAHFDELKAQYKGGVELALAAEYMLDSGFDAHLASGDLLPLSEGHLLVETSYYGSANNLMGTIDSIMSKGYYVVLAHPERYLYMKDADYKALKDRRVLFQLNLLSIARAYGTETQRRTKRLLKLGYYDLVGCDIHSYAFHKKIMDSRRVEQKYLDIIAKIGR